MKISVFLVLVCTLQLSASVMLGQQVSLQSSEMSVRQVFKELKTQTGTFFMYSENEIDSRLTVDVDFSDVSLEVALKEICEQASLNYEIVDDYVLITKKALVIKSDVQQETKIKGTVVDENGEPIPGVHVIVENPSYATTTNSNGEYIIAFSATAGKKIVIKYSFIGMKPQAIVVGDRTVIDIVMEVQASGLDEVVITGFFERKKETYTGNVSTVTGEELLKFGSTNMLKSLNQVDPSFRIVENNEFGSDPNKMPDISFRGASSFENNLLSESDKNLLKTNANLPTFVLDGFEVSLTDVIDLDMNRIESVTILKDAVAAAVYGSRAANGVFVIKTKDPIVGKMQVSYTSNFSLIAPDLSTYDLLSGPELLQYQENLGLYSYDIENSGQFENYNQIKQWLYEGVDSDWKSQPVRNIVSHKHTLSVSGGDTSVRYGLGVNYSDNKGVMKGSERKNLSMNLNLHYKLNDKLRFSNILGVNRNRSQDSPYGSYSDYLTLPSYFPMYDELGNLTERFGSGFWGNTVRKNPLLEAEAGNFKRANYTTISNNFALNWQIASRLKLTTRLGYSLNYNESEDFLSPKSVEYFYSSIAEDERGEYNVYNKQSENLSGNVMLNYSYGAGGHMVTATLGGTFNESKTTGKGLTAQGFSNKKYFPSFAKGYEINGRPSGTESVTRSVGLIASVNYAFNNIFLLDGSYRADGSSSYGNDSKFAPFFSVGTGLNLTQSEFVKSISWINSLRLTATYGEMGSVSFSPYQAKDLFTYYNSSRYRGNIGVELQALGNESLVWQTTKSKEVSLSFSLWDGVIDLNASAYQRRTVDMVTPVTLPSSTGFETMTANLGSMLNKGIEFNLRSIIYSNSVSNLIFAISGGHNNNRIESLGEGLKSYNDNVIENAGDRNNFENGYKFITQFQEGRSVTDLYAVRSLGIVPQTGEELFLDKNGKPTTEWNAEDMVVVGNTAPKIEGAMSLNFSYKRFTCSLSGMYKLGGVAYNSTLIEKVENADKWLNVDRRALEETWQKPGDVVPFKANINGERTRASSRFVQKNNQFAISSMNLQYRFGENVCEKLNMSSLSVGLNLNDLYYTSTIERERGTSYPFARTFSLSLNANF